MRRLLGLLGPIRPSLCEASLSVVCCRGRSKIPDLLPQPLAHEADLDVHRGVHVTTPEGVLTSKGAHVYVNTMLTYIRTYIYIYICISLFMSALVYLYLYVHL